MRAHLLLGALAAVLTGCSVGPPTGPPGTTAVAVTPTAPATTSPTGTVGPTSAPLPTCGPEPMDVLVGFDERAPLGPCTYFIQAEVIPVRVLFTVPEDADGWVSWFGTYKREADRPRFFVSFTVVNITNVFIDGCLDKTPRDPPVGPTVDDLATALAELPPFELSKPPTDVTAWGYSGKHLELTVPEMAIDVVDTQVHYKDCGLDESLKSWLRAGSGSGFNGYTGPGQREAFWILDVQGHRLVISSVRPPDPPAADIAELEAIFDSVEIEVLPS